MNSATDVRNSEPKEGIEPMKDEALSSPPAEDGKLNSEKAELAQKSDETTPPSSTETSKGFPSRQGWLNLWTVQNVITGANVIIIVFTVLFISLLSFFLSSASTLSAIETIGKNSASKLQLTLNNTFSNAILLNSYMTGVFQIDQIGLNDINGVAHQLIYIMEAEPSAFDSIYVSQVNATNTSDQALVFASRSVAGGSVNTIGLSGNFTDFMFTEFGLNKSCTLIDFSCPIANTSDVISSTPFDVTTRPYYIDATAVGGPVWTDPYRFVTGVFGITATTPVIGKAPDGQNVSIYLSSVDITLATFSVFIQNVSLSITSNPSIRIFMVDRTVSTQALPGCPNSGLLIATNIPEIQENVDLGPCLRQAVNSSDNIIDVTANEIVNRFGDFPTITPAVVGEGIVFTSKGYVIVIDDFDFGTPPDNISWLLVGAVPESVFLNQIDTLYRIIIPIVAPCIVILGVLASILLTRYITRPLKRLTEQLLTVANLDFDKITPAKPTDQLQLKEIARINGAVFTMISGLKSFAKYVPQDVVKLLLKMRKEAVLGVEEVDLTIYFSDIADFTSISEDLDPEALVALMSEYLQEMSTIILDHQGIVDKYIGDAVMAFWNAPLPIENHPMVGCEVALLTQSKLKVLQEKWNAQNYPNVRVRIGVNSGVALVGNLGSPERLSYTCIGDNVTLASRLEGLNKVYKTDILISESVHRCVKDAFLTRLLETIKVRGVDEFSRVYELICEKNDQTPPEIIAKAEIYDSAMKHYYEKDFEIAKNLFEKYLESSPEDLGATRHISSCVAFIEDPPSENWNGILSFPDY